MKVLWLSHFLPYRPTGHGALQRSHNLLVEAARRHEVHLVALAGGEDATPHVFEPAVHSLRSQVASVAAFPIGGGRERVHQIRAMVGGAVSAPSYWDRLFALPALNAHLKSVAAGRVDLVHVDILFLASCLHAVPGVPIALNHHNIESDLLRRRASNGQRLSRWYFARQAAMVEDAERVLARTAGVNLVVSALDGERLRHLAGDVAVTVVPNGVDVTYFQPVAGVNTEPSHLVFAGGMDWFPNRQAMMWLARELWPALRRDNAERRMTVVGRQPPPELVDAARHDPSLAVTGFVDDVRPYISRAAIYLCPITVGGGTRLKILDALAMARPLVSTDLGVEGLDLQEGRHYLGANSTDEFVAQVGRLEREPGLAHALATAGRQFVEQRYGWPAITDALDEGWRRAATRPRPPGRP